MTFRHANGELPWPNVDVFEFLGVPVDRTGAVCWNLVLAKVEARLMACQVVYGKHATLREQVLCVNAYASSVLTAGLTMKLCGGSATEPWRLLERNALGYDGSG